MLTLRTVLGCKIGIQARVFSLACQAGLPASGWRTVYMWLAGSCSHVGTSLESRSSPDRELQLLPQPQTAKEAMCSWEHSCSPRSSGSSLPREGSLGHRGDAGG